MHPSEEIKVLIIGLGGIGFRFDQSLPIQSFVLTHARAFSVHRNFRLVGGVDPDENNRTDFEAIYACNVYSEIGEALLKENPDIVVVATPTKTHNEVIKNTFAISKPSVIICEKPLAYTVNDAEEILSTCKNNQAQIYVNYMRNSSKVTDELIFRIKNNTLEPPFKVVNWYSKGVFNSASHFVTLFTYLFGEPQNIQALNRYVKDIALEDPDPDFKIDYHCGEVYFHSLDYHNFFHNSFELIAKNGRLLYERGGEFVKWFPVSNDGIYTGYKILSQVPVNLESDFATIQLEFVNNLWKKINGMDASICSGEDALHTMVLLYKILNLK
jgi:predicted dehydrogenase